MSFHYCSARPHRRHTSRKRQRNRERSVQVEMRSWHIRGTRQVYRMSTTTITHLLHTATVYKFHVLNYNTHIRWFSRTDKCTSGDYKNPSTEGIQKQAWGNTTFYVNVNWIFSQWCPFNILYICPHTYVCMGRTCVFFCGKNPILKSLNGHQYLMDNWFFQRVYLT